MCVGCIIFFKLHVGGGAFNRNVQVQMELREEIIPSGRENVPLQCSAVRFSDSIKYTNITVA